MANTITAPETLLSSILLPLPTVPPQATLLRPKRNLGPLGKKEDIALDSLDAFPQLVANLKVTVNNDFHLVVGVGIDQLWTGIEAVKSSGNGRGRGERFTGEDIAEKGIVICYERGLEIRLGIGVVLEGRTLGAHLGPRFLVRVGSFADTENEESKP